MTIVALEVDPPLRLVGVILDPETSAERRAAFADFLRHDLPDLDTWLSELRPRLGRYQEPTSPGDALLDCPNVLLTPHLAGGTRWNALRDMDEMLTGIAEVLR